MAFLVSFAMQQNHILPNIFPLDFADFCISGSRIKGYCKYHLVPGRQEGGVIEYRQKGSYFIIVKGADQNLGFFLHLNFQGGIDMDVFLLDGEAEVGTQTFENVVGVGCGELLTEKVLNIMLDVKGVDFLYLCNAVVLLSVDQKIQGIVVISFDRSGCESPKLTVQFELF